MKKVLLFLAATTLFVMPSHAGTAEKLDQIFQEDILGADAAYIQSIAGVPLKTESHEGETWQTYKIGKCKVEVTTDGHKVLSLSMMKLSPECTFDMVNMNINFPSIKAHEVTFGSFHGRYGSDCLMGCGNSVESTVTLEYYGCYAEDNINVTLSRGQNSDDFLNAVEKWREHILKHENEEYVMEGKYNDGKYNEVAQKYFKDFKIDRITFSKMW
ncbi:MAG: hypothetical protein IKX21_07855 [Deltaproteobacteria bacterium]|nr:hypothetical protein [Deltaproteobacteria bacterium]